jgi:hypothetical protein
MERLTCTARTLKNKQCSRNATYGDRCHQHRVEGKEEQVEVVAVAQKGNNNLPPTPFPVPSALLSRRIIAKIATKERQWATGKDTASTGFIYVYSLSNEVGKNFWKVGMTTRSDYTKRIKEWTAVHAKGDGKLVTKSVYTVEANCKILERLIHLHLDYCRMYRYPNGKGGYLTIYKTTGALVEEEEDDRPVVKDKLTEWFRIDWKPLKALILALRLKLT